MENALENLETEELLSLEWRRVVEQIDAGAEPPSRLSTGGHLKVAGSAECAEAWLRTHMEAVGGQVRRLDLDGWEPGAQDLEAFYAYQLAVTGTDSDPSTRSARDESARDGSARDGSEQDEALGKVDTGAGAAAALYLQAFTSPTSSASLPTAGLAETVDRIAGQKPLAIVVPSGDILPESLRQSLASLCSPGSGRLWVDVWPSTTEDADLRTVITSRSGMDDVGPGDVGPGDLGPAMIELLRRLDEVCPEPLRNALAHWALLQGESLGSAPLEPVLAALGLDDDSREQLIDDVDDELVEGETLEVLRDLQFLHPSFGDAVYRPCHALWSAILLHGISDSRQQEMATTLLSELRRRLKPGRGAFTVLLRLAEKAGDEKATARLRLRLRWWSDGRDLDSVIERALATKNLTPDQLWTLAGESNWPPTHRLAFLNAWVKVDGHPSRRGDVEMLRAEILHLNEQLPEALNAVRKALEIQGLNHGTKSNPYLAALHLCALLLAEADEPEVALEQMETCVELASELLPEDDNKRITIVENYGKVLVRSGRLRPARVPFEEALRLTEKKRGADHPATAIQRNNLAGLLLEMGELQVARTELRRAAVVIEATFGPRSMELYGALRNLAKVADELRDDEESLELLERLAPLEELLLGSRHPALLSTWTRQAELRRDTGDRDGARYLFERSLELAMELFYGDHPSIPALEKALSELR